MKNPKAEWDVMSKVVLMGSLVVIVPLSLATVVLMGSQYVRSKRTVKPPEQLKQHVAKASDQQPAQVEQRKHYPDAEALGKMVKGKTQAELVAFLGKPQQGKKYLMEKKDGTWWMDIWLYSNQGQQWRVGDEITGLGPENVIIRFTEDKKVWEVYTNMQFWDEY